MPYLKGINMLQKLKDLWTKLPKEVKVGVYVVVSASLTELAKYLTTIDLNSVILMAIINVVVVSVVEFAQRIRNLMHSE